MDWNVISTVINAVLMVVMVFLGRYWLITKTKISDVRELIEILEEAISDDEVTVEEMVFIQEAILRLIGRK